MKTWRRNRLGLALLAATATTACQSVSVGPLGVRAAVLVGPVERISQDAVPPARHAVAHIEAESKKTALGAGASGSRVEGGYVVTETAAVSASETYDDVARAVSKAWHASGARADDLIRIDELRVQAWFQNYVFLMIGGVRVTVEGNVMRADRR